MTATPKEVQLLSNGAAIISTWIFNRRTPRWVSPFLGGSSKLGPILVQWALPGSRLHLMSSLEALAPSPPLKSTITVVLPPSPVL